MYILAQSLRVLIAGSEAGTSLAGMLWVGATVAVMLALALAKRGVGQRLGNPALTTEATVTMIDAYLAAAVLLGLLANALFGWSWADPAAALVIVYYSTREGIGGAFASRSRAGRVALQSDLTILAKLSCALAQARAIPLTA